MTRGVRVRASSVVIVQEESSGMGGLGAVLGPMPGFMYAYRCTPLPLISTSGVAGPVMICPGVRACCELLPCVVGPESARFTGASSLSPAGCRMCA